LTDVLHTLRWDELRNALKARRESLGMTQGDLADMMGTHQTSISGWERGRGYLPTLDTVNRWCRALHLKLEFVITPREDPDETPAEWIDD
jgi:transcriptional regulator with XRE-family HTH domain